MPSETASMVPWIHAVGIVAEYNPFHNGHAYHLKKAKELSGADYAVVVMSPDFVQRGEPAIADKYTRTKTALLGGADLDVTPLHKTLLYALTGKKIFLLSTNVDNQFSKAGMNPDLIFATQGSYERIQCMRGCHPKTYDAVELFRQMDRERVKGRIPTDLVPKCPVCGGPMAMNLRSDNYFVQDEDWYAAEDRFSRFLSECQDGKTVLLELGVGFNTPTIIRFPFEKLTREHENFTLVRLSRSKAMVPASLGERAIGINADMARSITDIADKLKETEASKP